MTCQLKFKHFIFRYYLGVAIIGSGGGVAAVFYYCDKDRIPLVGSVVAFALAFVYFVLQQKLAEISLFKDLFTNFNLRYDVLNDELVRLEKAPAAPEGKDRQFVVDYFNLCAEEYLFYSEGYIHHEAWRAWCRGMLWYIKREPFQKIWKEEIAKNSYYGLTENVIELGSA